jgi:FkbM family methyltransferase
MVPRILSGSIRYYLAFENLGFISALKIFYYSLISNKPNIDVILSTEKFGEIHWNPKRDSVISHFFTPQIEIYGTKYKINVKTIVDLGAKIGTESIRFSKLYPNARIFAVEAVKENFDALLLNVKNYSKIKPIFAAIWDKKANLKLISRSIDSQSWYLRESLQDENYDIRGITLDEILKENNIVEIDILKVDIEGAEKQLFSHTCNKWINSVKCIIVEAPDTDSQLCTIEIFKIFRQAGFTFNTYISGENLVLIRSDVNWKCRSVERY